MLQNYIGTSGFSYKDWAGRFYPQGLPGKDWFDFYTRHFSAVEINSSFYHLPKEQTLMGWRQKSPAGFIFVLKGSQYITHRLRLKAAKESVELFSSRARLLGEKLGLILYQLPPGLHKDLSRLERFLQILPADIKHAIEFRHDSWSDEETFALLAKYQTAYCIISASSLKCLLRTTNEMAYIRFHGVTDWYNYNYSAEELHWWAERIEKFNRQNLPVYAFFNNDAGGYAAQNAQQLLQFLG